MKNLRTSGLLIFVVITIVVGLSIIDFRAQQRVSRDSSIKPSSLSPGETGNTKIDCSGTPITALTEGPYYTPGSPERVDLYEADISGEKIVIQGYVVDTDCQPIANAWLDFWQADGEGSYDTAGNRLRGHQFTNANGEYKLTTVIPGEYPGRTPHIHVKIRSTQNSPVITSQLFLPNASQNTNDRIFDEANVITMSETTRGRSATYTFVIDR